NHTCLLRSILPPLIIGTQGEQAQMSQSHLTAQVHSSTSGTDSGRPIPKKSQSHLTAQVHSSMNCPLLFQWLPEKVAIPPDCSGPFLRLDRPRRRRHGQEVAIPPDCSGPFLQRSLGVSSCFRCTSSSQSHLTAQVHSSVVSIRFGGQGRFQEVAIPPDCSGPFLHLLVPQRYKRT